MRFPKIASVLVVLALGGTGVDADNSKCPRACTAATFEETLPHGATVEKVAFVRGGSSYGEGPVNKGYPTNPTKLPALCAVAISVTSSSSSSYRFGLFLPVGWNSRFLAVGNGGFAGGINWMDMAPGAHFGFATVSTDTGHNSATLDVSWANGSPERQADWGWRALHGSVELGKKLTQAYYRAKVKYSYYSGCSTGGRQGMKEMQISPDSFDGVLVGAPAWYTKVENVYAIALGKLNLPVTDPKHISVALFSALGDEVVKQCDAADGVEDGIVSSPELCNFDYTKIQCGQEDVDPLACLTTEQIETAKRVYGDYFNDRGEFVINGLTYSSEKQWSSLMGGTEPSPFGRDYARYFLFNDRSWDWDTYNDSVLYYSEKKDAGGATAMKYDLSDFKARGGKMIMYHGLSDGLVPTKGSQYYYNQTTSIMGGPRHVRDFFRLFLIPGMQHCCYTPVDAPWAIGGGSQAMVLGTDTYSVPGYQDSKHDALLALVEWTEKGRAPGSIVATTWKQSTKPDSGVLRQRPICPFPEKAAYNGKGDINKADSWSCK